MKIVFATANPDKLKEVNEISFGTDIEFVLPAEGFAPIECGKTFEENALIKARAVKFSDGERLKVLADDSGLCVEALDGAPGLYSARYAGTQDEKIEKLLFELKNSKKRNAKFVCSMVLLDEDGVEEFSALGECKGEISLHRAGCGGFGYDPIFYLKGFGRTMAEISDTEKNKISHRAVALNIVIKYIHSTIK